MTGAERIAQAFASAPGGTALMPYMMGGFPDTETSLAVGQAYIDGGADLIELGLPFSDPLADGPVIQAAGNRALAAGAGTDQILEICKSLAGSVPVIVMVYVNVVLAAGTDRFAQRLRDAGASGLIVPDLPLEESTEMLAACESAGIALIGLVAPTSSDDRMQRIGRQARGFLYAVSVAGTTGERASLPELFADTIGRARSHTSVPVALGFGIAEPEQARAAAEAGADGVIVGSRLVRAVGEAADQGADPAEAVRQLVRQFRAALS
jgi:tryptophan synthase alpha chain